MQNVRHKNIFKIVPMTIIGDVDFVTKHIWETSKSIGDLEYDLLIEDEEFCRLDPGGMYCTKIPHKKFEIEGHIFDIQCSRIEEVLYFINLGEERIPGYIRFKMFRWFVILPKELCEKLKVKLEELYRSDEAMNYNLTEQNIKDSLVEDGVLVRIKKFFKDK